MRILMGQTTSENERRLAAWMKENLEAADPNTEVRLWEDPKRKITCADIRKAEAELFVNFNLSGFEQSTLTDGVAYNLSDCKQVHFLLSDKLANEKYLAKLLSISMFFYCTDEAFGRKLREKYPDIPYLKTVEGWDESGEMTSEKNVRALCRAVREVLEICHMSPPDACL